MQQAIAGLRAYFVVAPPPQGAVIDLTLLPGALWNDPDAAAAIQLITGEPTFDLDGYPGLISERELAAAEQYATQLGPAVQRGLPKLRALLGPKPPPPTARTSHTTPCGARIELYGDDAAALQQATRLVEGLARHPGFARRLADISVVVAPPGYGLDAIAGLGAGYEQAEGVAAQTIDPSVTDRLFVAIRHDSLMRWDLGLAHELIHNLHFFLDDTTEQRIHEVWESLRRPDAKDDPYANELEMMSFFGQWYLAGYGQVVEQLEPRLHALLQDVLGDARVEARGTTDDFARAALSNLLEWFRSGVMAGG
jgi:hypothetical protein